jgi:hypothetical protein
MITRHSIENSALGQLPFGALFDVRNVIKHRGTQGYKVAL